MFPIHFVILIYPFINIKGSFLNFYICILKNLLLYYSFYFKFNSEEGVSFFNTIVGSFNLLKGDTVLPFDNDYFYKNSLNSIA